jgi:hypothetical protein
VVDIGWLWRRRELLDAQLGVHDRHPAASQVLNVARGERLIAAAHGSVPTLKNIAQLAGGAGGGATDPGNLRRDGYRLNGHALTLHGVARRHLSVWCSRPARAPPYHRWSTMRDVSCTKPASH